MQQSEIEVIVRQFIGRQITATFGGRSQTVFVVSADQDGFICRPLPLERKAAPTEFWIAYSEVSSVIAP
jgi:hypothetical protein